jgi:hypothetical protein
MSNITVKFKGVELDVKYDDIPEQKESWGYHGGDQHIPAHIEIQSMEVGGVDVLELLEDFDKEIEVLITKELEL